MKLKKLDGSLIIFFFPDETLKQMDSKINTPTIREKKKNTLQQKGGILEYLFFFFSSSSITNLRTLALVKVANATDQRGTREVGTKRAVHINKGRKKLPSVLQFHFVQRHHHKFTTSDELITDAIAVTHEIEYLVVIQN
jgi:hypothetical protein